MLSVRCTGVNSMRKTEYIFSISTGRSGSDYLATIFKHVHDCQSFHEPQPIGNGREMRQYSQGYPAPMKSLTEKKVEIIKELKSDHQVYFESNHCFIKGFGWLIQDYFPQDRIGVIILKRNKSRVAESLLRIGCSPLNNFGRDWISTPDMKDPLVAPPKLLFSPRATYQCARLIKSCGIRSASFFTRRILRRDFHYPDWLRAYELQCLKWYVEETNAKAEAFMQQYPRIKYYVIDIESLNSIVSVERMLAHFGCKAKESMIDVVGKPTNMKQPQ